MLEDAVDHLLQNVLAAAGDYEAAEQELTSAFRADQDPAAWENAARKAKRRAAELAIAIDGLGERCSAELGMSRATIREEVSAFCQWPNSGTARTGALNRVRGVANAYKHQDLLDRSLPISSDADVLVFGLAYGEEGYGVGKFSGVEVLVREKSGTKHKSLGDAPVTIAAWFKFLGKHGAALPSGPYQLFNLQLHP